MKLKTDYVALKPRSYSSPAESQKQRQAASWSKFELKIFAELTTPYRIQAFLDNLPYSADPIYRSPRSVMRDGKAHCFDGALFAAAALRMLGNPPLIIDMQAERDDDHLLAVFKHNKHWGAIAKSNFVGLRFREPVYRNLRELVMSYFEAYYNTAAEKTLRGYTVPLNLSHYEETAWMTADENLDKIAKRLDEIRSFKLVSGKMVAEFSLVDKRSYEAGMLGTNPEGLYDPSKKA